MRKKYLFMIGLGTIVALSLMNCTGKKQNSGKDSASALKDSVWITAYEGTIPCADCPGIKTTLTLSWSKNAKVANTYTLEEIYIDRDTLISSGKFNPERGFKDDNDATIIVLDYDKPANEQRYYVYFSVNPKIVHVLSPEKEYIESDLNFKLEQIK